MDMGIAVVVRVKIIVNEGILEKTVFNVISVYASSSQSGTSNE